MMKQLIGVALLALSVGAGAQTSAAKKDLVNKILQMQQPELEMVAASLAERPAIQMMQEAGFVLRTRIPADKSEAVAKEIQADVKKYLDETVPKVRERAVKLAPSTIGSLLEEKFTEDELKQLVAISESPVNRKFSQLRGEMLNVLGEKLVAETQGTIKSNLKALELTITKRLGAPAKSAPAAGEAK